MPRPRKSGLVHDARLASALRARPDEALLRLRRMGMIRPVRPPGQRHGLLEHRDRSVQGFGGAVLGHHQRMAQHLGNERK